MDHHRDGTPLNVVAAHDVVRADAELQSELQLLLDELRPSRSVLAIRADGAQPCERRRRSGSSFRSASAG